MARIGTVEAVLALRDRFSRPLDAAGRRMERRLKGMERVAKRAAKGIAIAFIAASGAAVKLAADFSASMTKIETLVGVGRATVQGWKADVLALAGETARAPRELAEGLFFVTSAGLQGKDALEALKASAQAAALGLGDTATIADAVTSAMNAYGPSTLSATRATNVLALAVRAGKLEATQLAPVLGRLLPTASAMEVSFEDVAGVLAVMSRTGLDAAEASTSLGAIMSSMLKPTDQAGKVLSKVGLSMSQLRDMAAKPGGLVEAMRLLADRTKNLSEEALAQVIPNIRAFRGIMNVLAQDAGTVDKIIAAVAGKTDVLSEGMKRLAEEPSFQFQQAVAESKSALIGLGEQMKPVVTTVLTGFTALVKGINAVGLRNAFKLIWLGILQDIEEFDRKLADVFEPLSAGGLGGVPGGSLLANIPATFAEAADKADELQKELSGDMVTAALDAARAAQELDDALADLDIDAGKLKQTVGGAGGGVAEPLTGILKELADRLAEAAKAAEGLDIEKALRRLRGLRALQAQDLLPVPTDDTDLKALTTAFKDEFNKINRILEADLDKTFEDAAKQFAEHIRANVLQGLSNALRQAFTDAEGAMLNFFRMGLQQAGQAIGFGMGGPAGAMIGGAIGGGIGDLISSRFGGDDERIVRVFHGAVSIFALAADMLMDASEELLAAAHGLREQLTGLRRSLGGVRLFTGELAQGGGGRPGDGDTGGDQNIDAFGGALSLGGIFGVPDLVLSVQQIGDQFHASIQGLIAGVGDSLEDAIRNMMDSFVRHLPTLIEQGQISLEGVPKILADVLSGGIVQTYDELLAAIETATRFLVSSMGGVRAALFGLAGQLRTDLQDALRLGLDPLTVRQGTFAQIRDFVNQVAGVSAAPLTNARQAMAEFAQLLESLGIVGDRAARELQRFRDAIEASNLAARANVFGVLANWARELGTNANLQRRAARLSLKVEFLKLKLTAQTLGIWRRIRDRARDLFEGMLQQIDELGREVQQAGTGFVGAAQRAGDSISRAGEEFGDDVEAAAEAMKAAAEENRKTIEENLDTLRNMGRTLTPLERILEFATSNFPLGENTLPRVLAAANEALQNLVDGLKATLRAFREGLRFGPFGRGTPADKAQGAMEAFQAAIAAVLSGDVTQIGSLQALADQVLQLGSDAFGTSTAAFAALFDQVTSMLDTVLGAGFTLTDLNTGDILVEQAVTTQTGVLQGQLEASREQATRDARMITRSVDALTASLATFAGSPV